MGQGPFFTLATRLQTLCPFLAGRNDSENTFVSSDLASLGLPQR